MKTFSCSILSSVFSSQDFSNQVRYSTAYAAELKKHDAAPGRYVRPATAEFFSGLRKMSKSCFNMMVSLLPSKQDSRLLGQASKPMRCPGNSSLRCFLSNVRRPECSFHRLLIVEHADCQEAPKMAALSLFTGVAGLELGLSQWKTQLRNQREDHCHFPSISFKPCGHVILWLQIWKTWCRDESLPPNAKHNCACQSHCVKYFVALTSWHNPPIPTHSPTASWPRMSGGTNLADLAVVSCVGINQIRPGFQSNLHFMLAV